MGRQFVGQPRAESFEDQNLQVFGMVTQNIVTNEHRLIIFVWCIVMTRLWNTFLFFQYFSQPVQFFRRFPTAVLLVIVQGFVIWLKNRCNSVNNRLVTEKPRKVAPTALEQPCFLMGRQIFTGAEVFRTTK
jgi:hypothetical protein